MSALSIQDLNFYQNDLTEEETVTGAGWPFNAAISTSISSIVFTDFDKGVSAAGAAVATGVAVGKLVKVNTATGVGVF